VPTSAQVDKRKKEGSNEPFAMMSHAMASTNHLSGSANRIKSDRAGYQDYQYNKRFIFKVEAPHVSCLWVMV
jgi:hypothetical protein